MATPFDRVQGNSWIAGSAQSGIEQIDALERDAQRAAGLDQPVVRRFRPGSTPFAARLDVQERRAQQRAARRLVALDDRRLLQHVLAAARRMLRMGARVLQPLHAQREQQAVFVGERVVRRVFVLGGTRSGTQ